MSLFHPAPVLLAAAVAVLGGGAMAAVAEAAPTPGAVYVLGNQPSGNQVLVFDRAADGTLSAAGAYPTGGTAPAVAWGRRALWCSTVPAAASTR